MVLKWKDYGIFWCLEGTVCNGFYHILLQDKWNKNVTTFILDLLQLYIGSLTVLYMYVHEWIQVTYNLIRMCTTIFKIAYSGILIFFRTSKRNKTWFEKSVSSRNWGRINYCNSVWLKNGKWFLLLDVRRLIEKLRVQESGIPLY